MRPNVEHNRNVGNPRCQDRRRLVAAPGGIAEEVGEGFGRAVGVDGGAGPDGDLGRSGRQGREEVLLGLGEQTQGLFAGGAVDAVAGLAGLERQHGGHPRLGRLQGRQEPAHRRVAAAKAVLTNQRGVDGGALDALPPPGDHPVAVGLDGRVTTKIGTARPAEAFPIQKPAGTADAV